MNIAYKFFDRMLDILFSMEYNGSISKRGCHLGSVVMSWIVW